MILHVAYKLDNKKGRALSKHEKESVQDRKKKIQEECWAKMGLMLDFVKQGHGTTNDGNSARRFFREPKEAAKITQVDFDLISRLALILEVHKKKSF